MRYAALSFILSGLNNVTASTNGDEDLDDGYDSVHTLIEYSDEEPEVADDLQEATTSVIGLPEPPAPHASGDDSSYDSDATQPVGDNLGEEQRPRVRPRIQARLPRNPSVAQCQSSSRGHRCQLAACTVGDRQHSRAMCGRHGGGIRCLICDNLVHATKQVPALCRHHRKDVIAIKTDRESAIDGDLADARDEIEEVEMTCDPAFAVLDSPVSSKKSKLAKCVEEGCPRTQARSGNSDWHRRRCYRCGGGWRCNTEGCMKSLPSDQQRYCSEHELVSPVPDIPEDIPCRMAILLSAATGAPAAKVSVTPVAVAADPFDIDSWTLNGEPLITKRPAAQASCSVIQPALQAAPAAARTMPGSSARTWTAPSRRVEYVVGPPRQVGRFQIPVVLAVPVRASRVTQVPVAPVELPVAGPGLANAAVLDSEASPGENPKESP